MLRRPTQLPRPDPPFPDTTLSRSAAEPAPPPPTKPTEAKSLIPPHRKMGRGTSRRLVEGKCATLVQDMHRHPLKLPKHVDSPDPQNTDILSAQPIIPSFIPNHSFGAIKIGRAHV